MSRFRLARLVLPGLLALLTACSSTPPAPEPKPYPDLPADALHLARLWQLRVGEGVAGEYVRLLPALSAPHVAAASRDGQVVLVERESGRLLWRQDTGLALISGPGLGYGMLVLGTAKGEVVALAQADGHELWRARLGAAPLAAPAVGAELVVVLAADGVVHALARESGQVRWTYNTQVPVLSLRGNAAPLLADERVYVASSGGKLTRLDPATGAPDWELRVATNNGRSELERMNDIVGDLLRVGESELYSVGYQSQLTLTDVEAGRRRWTFEVSSVNTPAEGLGNVYVTDTTGNVLAVDRASGKPAWKQADFAYRRLTNPVVLGNVLAVGDDEGRVHLLAQSDGAVRGRVRVSRAPLLALQVHDEVLYAWDEDGRLSAWRLR